MKIEFSRTALLSALRQASGGIPSRSACDAFRYVKASVFGITASFLASDGEIHIEVTCPTITNAPEKLEFLLPCERILNLLRELSGDVVSLCADGKQIEIRCGLSEFDLSTADVADYPKVGLSVEGSAYSVSTRDLSRMLSHTSFCIDTVSSRYALGGVCFSSTDGLLTLAATDGRRLGVDSTPVENNDLMTPKIVPGKAVALMRSCLSEPADSVSACFDSRSASFTFGSASISCQLVDGRFPKWQDVIPKRENVKIEIPAGVFAGAVRQSIIVTTEESSSVSFSFSPGTLSLKSSGADVGASKVDLPISFDGDGVSVDLNPKYLVEFLKSLDKLELVTVCLVDGDSAVKFGAGESCVYVLMPMSKDR